MKSRWFEYKEQARELRRQGASLTVIHRKFGIPKSTLSGWLKDIELTEVQRTKLMKNKIDGWQKAREHALQWHYAQKNIRIEKAYKEAKEVYSKIPKTIEVLELALAMLYFGEGSKNYTTSMGSSDPKMIVFFISALEKLYGIDKNDLRYELHLRYDQNSDKQKHYWSKALNVNVENFTYVIKDRRTIGKPTKPGYNGVCQVHVGQIQIQRRLKALYQLYCTGVWVRSSVG